MTKRAWLIGAFGYVLLVLSVELERFPGLHGDEAWFGLGRVADRRRAVLLFLLLGSSLLFLWMSRVAWEVTGSS